MIFRIKSSFFCHFYLNEIINRKCEKCFFFLCSPVESQFEKIKRDLSEFGIYSTNLHIDQEFGPFQPDYSPQFQNLFDKIKEGYENAEWRSLTLEKSTWKTIFLKFWREKQKYFVFFMATGFMLLIGYLSFKKRRRKDWTEIYIEDLLPHEKNRPISVTQIEYVPTSTEKTPTPIPISIPREIHPVYTLLRYIPISFLPKNVPTTDILDRVGY